MTRWDVTEQPAATAGSTVRHRHKKPDTAEKAEKAEKTGGRAGRAAVAASGPCALTEREREWLRLLGEDCPPAEPAPPAPPATPAAPAS